MKKWYNLYILDDVWFFLIKNTTTKLKINLLVVLIDLWKKFSLDLEIFSVDLSYYLDIGRFFLCKNTCTAKLKINFLVGLIELWKKLKNPFQSIDRINFNNWTRSSSF